MSLLDLKSYSVNSCLVIPVFADFAQLVIKTSYAYIIPFVMSLIE